MTKFYTLYNKKLDRRLVHPKVGLWFTTELEEAKAMRQSCLEYLNTSNLSTLAADFVVIDAETGEEISV